MKYITTNVFLPRPQRLYPWLKSYRKRFSIETKPVEEVLSDYGLALIKRPIPIAGGFRNLSLLVNTSLGKKIFKKYQENLGTSTIIQEHSILKYLSQIDFPATRLVETKSGQTFVQRGKDRYALFDHVDGSFRIFDYIVSPKQTRQFIAIAGQMLAILHDKLADFTPQGYNPDGFKSKTDDRWRDIEWFAKKLAFSVNKTSLRNEKRKKNKYTLLLQNARKLETILFDNSFMLNSADLPRQIIHKNYSPGHLLLRKNLCPVIIDFEIARLDWRLVDIIDGFRRFCRNGKGHYCHNKKRNFLSNYQAQAPLTSAELYYIPFVWELMISMSCIYSWDQHSSTGCKIELIRAFRRLKELYWVTENRDAIMTTLTMSKA